MSTENTKPLFCPICKKQLSDSLLAGKNADPPLKACLPFCSRRCLLVDLGQWLNGSYAIPCQTTPPDDVPDEP